MDDQTIYTAYLKGSLCLSKDGDWFHNGSGFSNQKVIDFFHHHIQWSESDKQYYIAYGKGRAEFDCEDCAYFVLELLDNGSLPLQVRLADQSIEDLDLSSLHVGQQNRLYCKVKQGHAALFKKAPYQRLAQFTVSE